MTAFDYISDLDERLTITESCIKTGSGPTFVGGEANKLTFTWSGDKLDMEDPSEFIAKYRVGHTDSYGINKEKVETIIDSQEDFTNSYTFIGDIYCLVIGGSTSYFHFVVLDSSCIVK